MLTIKKGFRNRFRNGRNGGQQNGDQDSANQEGDGNNESTAPASSTSSAAPASVGAATSTIPLEPQGGLVLPPTSVAEPAPELQTTTSAEVLPITQTSIASLVGIPYVAPSNSVNLATLSGFFAAEPSLSPEQPPELPPELLSTSSLVTTEFTVTSSSTVFVTETSVPLSNNVPAEEGTPASAQATPSTAPALDLAPLPESSTRSMSAGEKAGLGIGITLVLLAIAGAVVFFLLRRRKSSAVSGTEGRRGLALGGFFGPKDGNKPKPDPEWSIESASKVSILRAGSVKSVSSNARTATPTLPPPPRQFPLEPKLAMGTEVVKVGMTVPDRKLSSGLANLALRSNPPISPSAFPSPPESREREREDAPRWPLSN